ncbi:thioredoxin fold domain-containing protein [Colwellia sp. D2M02]|nr:thioredoxin fold domain-containing protein [Colwellia sp. D2M02]MBU2894466.1 thioredoxin fold domain-containing protein [Colwellia sp. D2M02]
MHSKFITYVITAIVFIVPTTLAQVAIANENVPALIASSPSDKFDAQMLKEVVGNKLGLNVVKVEKTPMNDLAAIHTEQGLFYSSYNGEFLIHGKLYSIKNELTDLTEQSLAAIRLEGVKSFANDVITYPAKDEKYVVTVFTDITCGYCRKMHAEMAEYNKLGITFRYLAYPRSGINDRLGNFTDGFKDLRSVWCNDDSADALTRAKSGAGIAYRICDKPIEAQFNFGRQIGVTGTPAIILPNGMMVPGYKPPAQLEAILKEV